MPVYEFYCPHCHTMYSFRSRSVNTETTPSCPGCAKDDLKRQISSFAVVSDVGKESRDPFDELPIDESKMEQAMASLAGEAEGIDENDPRAVARLMRTFSKVSGLEFNEKVEAALERLESGEDPDTVEKEMDELMEEDELPFELRGKKWIRSVAKPRVDDKLYDM